MQQFKAEKIAPPLPEVSAGHLLSAFLEMGPAMSSGMGGAPITFGEIDAWQRCTGIPFAPWEVRAIRVASHEYLGFLRTAEDPDCPAPWQDDEATDAVMDAAANRMRRSLRAMSRGRG